MSTNAWPTPQDYNEAVQNPRHCFSDPDLKCGVVDTNALGLPRAMTGAFASVYKVTSADKSWAVRCFLTSRLDQKDRYKHISDFVLFDNLDCTIDFHYLEEGINVKGKWYPCLKMPWVQGETLDQFLWKNYKTPGKMKELLEQFHKMVDELECAGIGHGDMQHGNIIVTNQGLRLVDYDALYVPALLGRKSLELGHPNYQHPQRDEHHFDPDVDNFSCWLIHASLLALAIDPELYDKYNGGDDCILFKRTDLACPENSQLFNALLNHESSHLRDVTLLLKRMLWAAPYSIPILDCPEECFELLPVVPTYTPVKAEAPVEQEPAAAQEITAKRNRFDFIDDDFAQVQATAKKKSKKATGQKIEELNQARKKVADDFYLFFAPYSWIHHYMEIALRQFDSGNYEAALNTYLRVYKVMTKQNVHDDKNLFWCLMGLGYCSALSDKNALAGNYFLLANKISPDEISNVRSNLCLSLVRYESGDEKGAFKTLKDKWHGSRLLDAIRYELKNMFIARATFFTLLRTLGDRLSLESNEGCAREAWQAAHYVFSVLAQTNSIQLTGDDADSLCKLAAGLSKNGETDKARSLYEDVGRAAIGLPIKTTARNALFNACSLFNQTITLKHEKAKYHQNLKLLAESYRELNESAYGSRLKGMITSAESSVTPQALMRVLADLSGVFVELELREHALVTTLASFERAYGNVDPYELVTLTTSYLNDEEIWNCLSKTYLKDEAGIKIILECFAQSKNTGMIKQIVERLADSGKSVLLTACLMHLIHNHGDMFAELASGFTPQQNTQSLERAERIAQALDQAGQCFAQELARLCHQRAEVESSFSAELSYITSLETVRAFLSSAAYDVEAASLTTALLKPEYSHLMVAWMLEQIRQSETWRLVDFIRVLVDNNDIDTVGEFVLRLANADTIQGLESVINNLRAYGMKKETFEAFLLPAADRCRRKLEAALVHGIKPTAKPGEPLIQLRALYRLKSMAIDADAEKGFKQIIDKLFIPEWTTALTALMIELAKNNESILLRTMALDLAEHDTSNLEDAIITLSSSYSEESIAGICMTLLENGGALSVVSIAQKVGEKNESFFKTLSLRIVRAQSDASVLQLAQTLIDHKNDSAVATLIRQAKAFNRTELVLKLLALSMDFVKEKSAILLDPSGAEHQDALNATLSAKGLSAVADLVHLSALSGDKKLASLLEDIDQTTITSEDRKALFNSVVFMCQKSLSEYVERISNSGDPTGKLKVMGILNISALDRLTPLVGDKHADNLALVSMFTPAYRDLTLAWLMDLAEKNENDKVACIAISAIEMHHDDLFMSLGMELAAASSLRSLIVLSKRLSNSKLASYAIRLATALVENDRDDAFGSVSLEIVTSSTVDDDALLSLLESIANIDRSSLRVLMRQICFYRNRETLLKLARVWTLKHGEEGNVSLVQEELKTLGYVTSLELR